MRIGLAVAALAAGGWAGWALTAGRRVRDLPARPLLAAGVAVLMALGLVLGMRTATFVRTKGARGPALVWALALLAERRPRPWSSTPSVLPRSYPGISLVCCSWRPCWPRPWQPWGVLPSCCRACNPEAVRMAAAAVLARALRSR